MSSQVHARFRLNKISRFGAYYKAPGEQEAKAVEGVYVEFGAVQGEPFGNATPSGNLTMGIANPAAAELFREAPIGQEFDLLISPVEQA